MKMFGSIFNMISMVLIAFLILAANKVTDHHEKQFEELRLRYALDYSAEAAFRIAIESGSIDTEYEDMAGIHLNPGDTLNVFKYLLCLNYNMSPSDENFTMLDKYVAFATLVTGDGYYMAELQEVDNVDDGIEGGEYELKWGLKKPYAMEIGNKLVALNLFNETWKCAEETGSGVRIASGGTYKEAIMNEGLSLSKTNTKRFINQHLSEAINESIKRRNKIYTSVPGGSHFVYLPTAQTQSGVNTIERPTFIVMLQGVDFAGSFKLSAKSVAGFTTTPRKRVLGFVEGGVKYYCYESQIPEHLLDSVDDFYSTVDEAASLGYRPHLTYLRKPILKK